MTITANFSSTVLAADPPIRARAAGVIPASQFRQVMPAVLLFYAIIMPPEMGVYFGDLLFNSYRAMLYLFLPWIFYKLVKGTIAPMWSDFAILLIVLWIPVSLYTHYDMHRALISGGSVAGDMLLSYLIGRLCIRSMDNLSTFLKFIAPGLLFAALLVMAESLSQTYFVRPLASKLSGISLNSEEIRTVIRAGLFRGMGSFSHAILAGAFLASFLPLYLAVKPSRSTFLGIPATILSLFSLSSGAMLGLILSALLIGYDRFQRQFRDLSWPMACWAGAFLLLCIEIFSQGGVVSIVYRYLTFNAQTGWYRTQIWRYAGADALANPWFGIGIEHFNMPSWLGAGNTIDAYFLFLGVTYGIIVGVTFFLLCLGAILQLGAVASRTRFHSVRKCYAFLAIAMASEVLMMFTVAYWGSLLAWIFVLLGICYSLVQVERAGDPRFSLSL